MDIGKYFVIDDDSFDCFPVNDYSNAEETEEIVNPLIDNFKGSDVFSDLFVQLIAASDSLGTYGNWGEVWIIKAE